jgi:hypothetical protein
MSPTADRYERSVELVEARLEVVKSRAKALRARSDEMVNITESACARALNVVQQSLHQTSDSIGLGNSALQFLGGLKSFVSVLRHECHELAANLDQVALDVARADTSL